MHFASNNAIKHTKAAADCRSPKPRGLTTRHSNSRKRLGVRQSSAALAGGRAPKFFNT